MVPVRLEMNMVGKKGRKIKPIDLVQTLLRKVIMTLTLTREVHINNMLSREHRGTERVMIT